jgi:hypothetical protein
VIDAAQGVGGHAQILLTARGLLPIAMQSAIVAAMLGAVAAWDFYQSLAGHPAFGTIFE